MSTLCLVDEAHTLKLAHLLNERIQTGIVFLQGDLGAGKTTLVRAWLQAAGISGRIKSPTYSIVESYAATGRRLYHFDLYRLESRDELEEMGIRDYFSTADALFFIEWPYKVADSGLPAPDLVIQLSHAPGSDSARLVQLDDPQDRFGDLAANFVADQPF